ncbi:ABC transporter permease [Qingshengfaniella alkalisoli]|uniref:ABC transporter permease n=1 Tax=Qingshengfaniella alkalisoli TaxID=2599296 RepID=A0A5B8IZG1_9RHOB|nr:ABC transporter permease [Qingshengfaniella alkalisoli]QDY71074.1 ABC transporter permease [Qingshengfaniella alkalisoli]
MIQFEKRDEPSRKALILVPLIAVALSIVGSSIFLTILGKPPLSAMYSFFVAPFESFYSITEILLKFGPLLLIAQALAVGFRAKVWNIGAEGQMIAGAVAASSLPILYNDSASPLMLPAMVLLGVLGGMAWAGVAALLKTRFNASEILVTLMLNSVAIQLLYYLVLGPWKDPMGFNFPQSVLFQDAALFPMLFAGARLNLSILLPLIFTVFVWILMQRRFEGFKLMVSGLAPDAASYAGFNNKRAIWFSLLLAGGAAGLAGMAEVAGPIGQLQRSITSGYGYSAIIVAYLGALHPVGIVFAAFFLAVISIGGDIALVSADIPISAVRVFQGMLLVFYLASYTFVTYRVHRARTPRTQGEAT